MEPVWRKAIRWPGLESDGSRVSQLYRAFAEAIREDRLADGHPLPSTRAASVALGVSRNTMIAAYDLLRAEGLIAQRRGAVPVVLCPRPATREAVVTGVTGLSVRGTQLTADLRDGRSGQEGGVMAPGCPDEVEFPGDLWGRGLRRSARRRQGAAFGYGDYHGLDDLRSELVNRLAMDRGMRVHKDEIVVLPGTQAGLVLAAQVLADPGQVAAMEDPGYAGARAAFLAAGLKLSNLPVDSQGADPSALDGVRDLRLVYLTPSNQHPLGPRLPHHRRAAFLDRARRAGAVILEDDYDGEFQWRGQEIAALQTQATAGEVIYLGTAAKALMPGVRLGWMVVPRAMVDPMRIAQRNLGLGANVHAQAALADMMRSGQYRAHLRRIARLNRERGEALVAALANAFANRVGVDLPDGGVQLSIRLGDRNEESSALAALNRAGFATAALSAYGVAARLPGLVTGFADATPERVARFVAILKSALDRNPAGGR